MKTRIMISFFTFVLILCTACGGGSPAKRPGLQQAINTPQEYPHESYGPNNPGSLFAQSEQDTLFSDSRARRVGDIIVVKMVENTKAQHKAETTADKETNNNYSVGAFFGRDKVGFLPLVGMGPLNAAASWGPHGPVGQNTSILNTGSASDLNATGKTKRENYVITSMAARVTRVLPGGLLQIEGAREIRVNEETEYMVVRGMVRAKDVDAENTVYSTQIADASIEYYGKGVLSDKQKPGWFTRLMDNVWPF